MELIVNIKKGSETMALEMLKNLRFVKKVESKKERILNELSEAAREVSMIVRGEKKGIPLDQVLDEL